MRIDFLGKRRVSDRWQAPFVWRTNLDENGLRSSAPAPTKGTPPFRKEMPEAFCRGGLGFTHDCGPRGRVPGRKISMQTMWPWPHFGQSRSDLPVSN
jgi:hypothetical protein